MDVHVLPGFLPEKNKRGELGSGWCRSCSSPRLLPQPNANMPAEHDDYQTVEPPNR